MDWTTSTSFLRFASSQTWVERRNRLHLRPNYPSSAHLFQTMFVCCHHQQWYGDGSELQSTQMIEIELGLVVTRGWTVPNVLHVTNITVSTKTHYELLRRGCKLYSNLVVLDEWVGKGRRNLDGYEALYGTIAFMYVDKGCVLEWFNCLTCQALTC